MSAKFDTNKNQQLFDASLSGAHIHNRQYICNGYRLVDGMLIDIDGNIIHQWNFGYLGTIAHNSYFGQQHYESQQWGRFKLNDDPIWTKAQAIHHQIIPTDDGIITFTKECHHYKGRDVDFDVIVKYDINGNQLESFSLWDHLSSFQKHHKKLELDLPKRWFLPELVPSKSTTPWGGNYDYYRLNNLQVLPDTVLGHTDQRFQPGNWLVTFRHGSMLFILDKDSKAIVWKAIANDIRGGLQGPHGAQMLTDGTILVFDNGRYRKQSRVIQLDPTTYTISWEYTTPDLFTLSQGYAQRLPNGNTLITHSEKGHAIEVTNNGDIVWEFYHPHKQDKHNQPAHPQNWGKRQWIYRMTHIPTLPRRILESF